MPVRMTGFAFGRRTEDRGDVVLPLDVGLVCEIQVPAIRLRFAGERGLEVVVRLRAFQFLHRASPRKMTLANHGTRNTTSPAKRLLRWRHFARRVSIRPIDCANSIDNIRQWNETTARRRRDEATLAGGGHVVRRGGL